MATSPQIVCPLLSAYDPSDLNSVRQTFCRAPACVLQQSWLAKPEPGFEPGTVRAGWHNDSLVLLAELKDTDIYTHARYPNERLWELGDTLEIFLRPLGQAAYNEFQVAPNNLRAQLRFANAAALLSARKHDAFEDVLVPGDHFSTRTWVQPDMGQWYVLLEIPVRTVGDQPHSLKGSEWLFSFCRCDYTRGRPAPVLSSTSVHAQPDFHRQVEWGTLRFECSRKVNRCDFIKKGIGAREDATR